MATTPTAHTMTRGGGFLVTSSRPEDVFTPAELSDDQKLIGQTAEEFMAKEVIPLVPELEQHKHGLMSEVLKKAGELGLLGGGIPEAYGGTGLDKVSTTLLAEKLSSYASFAVTHGGHAGIGTVPIVYFGTEEQKKKYLPKIATGEWISCYCLSEPQAGSDALAARTRATLSPDGKHWILNGQKMWITNGGFADVFVVFAKVDGEKFSCFLVERSYPGFSSGAEEKKIGIKGSSTVPIFFENCPVPRENLLHEIGRGHIVAFNTLNAGRFSLGAYCLGGSKKTLEAASKYSKERTAFGKQLREFGLIEEKLGEMVIRIFALDSMIFRTAGTVNAAVESGAGSDKAQQAMQVLEEYAIESSICKVFASEVLDYVVDEAVQIFGGYGYHEDYPVARAYRDSRINRIFEGTNEINRMLIIQMLMKRAMGGVLPLIPAAMKLAEEAMSLPQAEEAPDHFLGEEERLVAQAKKAFLLAAGAAVQKFREKLADEQEIVAALANVVMEIYAMESSLLRTQKAAARAGEASTAAMADAVRSLIHDSMDRVEREARRALAATAEGDMLRTQLAMLRRFVKHEPLNTIAIRRKVAQAVLAQDRYPFEGR
ncbi:MAG: acyl-CoA dehydrogenase family protein [Candidatus Acidiferrales bacterium]